MQALKDDPLNLFTGAENQAVIARIEAQVAGAELVSSESATLIEGLAAIGNKGAAARFLATRLVASSGCQQQKLAILKNALDFLAKKFGSSAGGFQFVPLELQGGVIGFSGTGLPATMLSTLMLKQKYILTPLLIWFV